MRDVIIPRIHGIDMNEEQPTSRVKSVDTTLDVIQCLHRHGTASIEEIAAETGRGSSTVHRHLVTLRERGYVIDDGGAYRLSLMFLTRGGVVRASTPAAELLDRKVRQISEETGERAQFMTEENGQRVYVFTHSGPSGVKTDATVGKRGPLHVSAAGKAILAFLPAERIDEILDAAAFDQGSPNAITDRDTVESELAAVRERGYAFNDEESTEGLRAVGVPVRFDDESVLGAISVSGPAHRFRDEYFREELPDLLLGAANELELNLKYP